MKETKHKKGLQRHEHVSLVGSRVDVDWLLNSTQNGVEDAEAILIRRVKRTGTEQSVTDLGCAWADACYSVELLFDLLTAKELKATQAEQFEQFLQRIKRLLPSIRNHQLLEPRLNWSDI
jgi:uncharacterized heparinase superfamily protein